MCKHIISFFLEVYITYPVLVTELHLPFKLELSFETCKNVALLSVRLPRYEQQCPPTGFHSWILKIKMKLHWWQTPGLHQLQVSLSLQEFAENPSHENADNFTEVFTKPRDCWVTDVPFIHLYVSHTRAWQETISPPTNCIVFISGMALMERAGPVQTVWWKLLGLSRAVGNGALHKNWINYSVCNNSYTLQRDTGHLFQSFVLGGPVGSHKSSTPTIRIYYYLHIWANKGISVPWLQVTQFWISILSSLG